MGDDGKRYLGSEKYIYEIPAEQAGEFARRNPDYVPIGDDDNPIHVPDVPVYLMDERTRTALGYDYAYVVEAERANRRKAFKEQAEQQDKERQRLADYVSSYKGKEDYSKEALTPALKNYYEENKLRTPPKSQNELQGREPNLYDVRTGPQRMRQENERLYNALVSYQKSSEEGKRIVLDDTEQEATLRSDIDRLRREADEVYANRRQYEYSTVNPLSMGQYAGNAVESSAVSETRKQLREAEHILDNTNKPGDNELVNFFRTLGQKAGDFGEEILRGRAPVVSPIVGAAEVNRVIGKIDKAGAFDDPSRALDKDELMLWEAVSTNLAAKIQFANSQSWGSKTGAITADMIPFIVEMYLTGGITKGIAEASEKALTSWMVRLVGGKLKGLLASRLVGTVGSRAAQTSAMSAIAPSTYEHAIEGRYDLSKNAQVNDDGTVRITGAEKKGVLASLSGAWLDSAIEMFTERNGAIAPFMKYATQNILMTAAGKRMANSVLGVKLGQIGTRVRDITGKGAGQALAGQILYNGIIGEGWEEIEGALYRGELGEFFTWDNLVPMMISFAIPGAVTSSVSGAQYGLYRREYKKADEAVTSRLHSQGLNNSQIRQVKDELSGVSVENTGVVISGFVEKNFGDRPEGEKRGLKSALGNYVVQYAQFSSLDSRLNGERHERAEARLQESERRIRETVEANVNADSGTLMTARLKTGAVVQVVASPGVVFDDNGKIDAGKSSADAVIAYIDKEGKRQVVPARDVADVLESINVEDATEQLSAPVREGAAAQMRSQDAAAAYSEGDEVLIDTDNKGLYDRVTILSVSEDGQVEYEDREGNVSQADATSLRHPDEVQEFGNGVRVEYSLTDKAGKEIRRTGTVTNAFGLTDGYIEIEDTEGKEHVINRSDLVRVIPPETSETDSAGFAGASSGQAVADPESELSEGISRAFGSMAGSIEEDSLNAVVQRLEKDGSFVMRNPDAVQAAKANPRYSYVDNGDGSITVNGILGPDGKWHGQMPAKGDLTKTGSAESAGVDAQSIAQKIIAGNQQWTIEELQYQKNNPQEIENALKEIQRQEAASKEVDDKSVSLTEEQASELIARMEANAVEAPTLELTPENW